MNEEEKINEPTGDNQPSTENISDNNIQPTTLNIQHNENMEAHHPHHVTYKKKWGEYLLEFFMLFLAVFLGFVAENLREHQVEKEKEKVYMQNMLEDLISDAASFKNYAANASIALRSIDTLVFLLKSPERKLHVNTIYFLARTFTMRNDLLFTNERAYDQMKSSGHLRLIHNQQIADSVSYYYNSLKQINNQNERITGRINEYFLSMSKLFDAEVLLQISKDRKIPEGESTKLLTEDPMVINEILTRAQYLYAKFLFTANLGLERNIKAENLIRLIQKEYHLEND